MKFIKIAILCLSAFLLTSCSPEFIGSIIGQNPCEAIKDLPPNDTRKGSWTISKSGFSGLTWMSSGTGEEAKRALKEYKRDYTDGEPDKAEFCPNNDETTKVENNELVTRNSAGTVLRKGPLTDATTTGKEPATVSTYKNGRVTIANAVTRRGKLVLDSKWQSDAFPVPGKPSNVILTISVSKDASITAQLSPDKKGAFAVQALAITNLNIYENSRKTHFTATVTDLELDIWIQESANGVYPMNVRVIRPALTKPSYPHLIQIE